MIRGIIRENSCHCAWSRQSALPGLARRPGWQEAPVRTTWILGILFLPGRFTMGRHQGWGATTVSLAVQPRCVPQSHWYTAVTLLRTQDLTPAWGRDCTVQMRALTPSSLCRTKYQECYQHTVCSRLHNKSSQEPNGSLEVCHDTFGTPG